MVALDAKGGFGDFVAGETASGGAGDFDVGVEEFAVEGDALEAGIFDFFTGGVEAGSAKEKQEKVVSTCLKPAFEVLGR